MNESQERADFEVLIRYDVLYEYAQAHQLDYNELCRVVRSALVAAPVRAMPFDAITVNLVRLVGLDKHKARECEQIMRTVLTTVPQVFICTYPECGCRTDLGEDWTACRPETSPSTKQPAALCPCRSPYCECELGHCTRSGYYDARAS